MQRRPLPSPQDGHLSQVVPHSPRALRPASITNSFDLEQGEYQPLEQPYQTAQDPFQDPSYSAYPQLEYGYDQPYSTDPYVPPSYHAEEQEANDIEKYLLSLDKEPTVYDTTEVDFSPRNYQREWTSKERVLDDGASSRSGASFRSGDTASDAKPKLHFGPAPSGRQERRNAHNAKKRVALTHGNLVLDCPIPSRLNTFLPRKDAEEYRFMRYSAVTCDPDDFDKSNFTVRPALLGRETELCIAVTMYNEDEILFCRTMHNVMKNISHLCSREKSSVWGKDGWKKVVVVIIADGRKAIHPRVLDCLSAMGVYQPGVAKNIVEQNGQQMPVQAHLYEMTTQLSVSPDLKFKGLEKGIVPTQVIFCLKEQNARKLNSHRWFFNAICPQLQPNICILLDVGTKPGPKSLYHLWKTFNRHSNVGGACGEISVMKGKLGLGLINPLVACQNFEYKMSSILDKPTESVFGYISVLPDRYIALQNDALGHGPLNSYFKGEHMLGQDADVFTANLYLAEDRILCWELVAKASENWVLKYVAAATGETDVPDTAEEWISQRRRWLNGSFFAAVYAQTHVMQIFKTDHTIWKKMALVLESIYQLLNLFFSWFALANFYCFFIILTSALEDKSFGLKGMAYVNMVAQYLYAATIVATFVFSMGNRPQPSKWQYMGCMISFTVLTAYMMGAAIFCIVKAATNLDKNPAFPQIVLSLAATYGVYVLSSLLALDPWHLITSMGQYLLMQAIYINLLQTYALCNVHDLSWGTKQQIQQSTDLGVVKAVTADAVEISLPTSQADIDVAYDEALHSLKTRPKILKGERTQGEREQMRQDYYRNVRTNVLLLWLLCNGILAACILHGDVKNVFSLDTTTTTDDPDQDLVSNSQVAKVYMLVILAFVTALSIVRLALSTTYLIMGLFGG